MTPPELLQGTVILPGGIEYPKFRLSIIGAGLAVAAGLFWLVGRTVLGIRIRAGECDREMIAALGVNIGLLYTMVFALGAGLAGLAGAMVGSIQSVQVGMGEPVLILAFVVIVIGGIGSVTGAFIGSILVGLADTLGSFLFPVFFGTFMDASSATSIGSALASMLIYLLMAAVLVFKPGDCSEMSALERGLNFGLASLLLVVPLIAANLGEPYYLTLAARIAILSLAAVGLNFALGLGGLVSFGHAAYFGLGGYAAGILANHALRGQEILAWPFEIDGSTFMPTIWLVAVLVAGLAALLIGLLSLRTTGVYFIMITLAFAQMLYYFAVSWPAYGGEDGLPVYVRNRFPGLNTMDPVQFFLISYAILLAALALFSIFGNSNFGLALRASKQNPSRVESLGIHVYRLRLTAFVVSGAITGLAGALYADLNRYVGPQMLSWQTSGEIMVFIILGGIGRLFGPVAGAILYIVLEQSLGEVSDYCKSFSVCCCFASFFSGAAD